MRSFQLILLICTLLACKNSTQQSLIVGKWHEKSYEIIEGEEEYDIIKLPSDTSLIEDNYKKTFKSSYYLKFSNDGQIIHFSNNHVLDKAKYKINDNKLTFSGVELEIVTLNKDSLVVKKISSLGGYKLTFYERVNE